MMAGLVAGLLTASHQHQHDECATVDMCWLHCPVYWILIATLDNGEENTAPRPRPRGSPDPWLTSVLFPDYDYLVCFSPTLINYADGGGRRKTLIVVIVVSSLCLKPASVPLRGACWLTAEHVWIFFHFHFSCFSLWHCHCHIFWFLCFLTLCFNLLWVPNFSIIFSQHCTKNT